MTRSPRLAPGLTVLSLVLSGFGCKEKLPPLPPDEDGLASRPADPADGPPLDGAMTLPAMPAAPHHGRLLPMHRDTGYVEWLLDSDDATVRLYFLDAELNAIAVVEPPLLMLASPTGPQEIPVRPLESAGADRGFIAQSDLLRHALPDGLIRFHIGGEAYRVLLPTRPEETESAELPEPDTEAGATP